MYCRNIILNLCGREINEMNYSIRILDKHDKLIGEQMSVTPSDILKYINKGYRVIDMTTGQHIDEATVNQTIGVSDGLVSVG